jgi:anti-sigma-K factor RskA
MTQPELHDLAAAYALDALDPEDRWTYERHLDECERCRDEVAKLRETATELAYVTEGPAPSPELRDRILQEARAGAPAEVVPLRRRWLFPATAAAAVAAAAAAVALGLWANSLRGDSAPVEQRVVPVQSEQAAGNLIVAGDEGTLVVCLDEAPSGKTYEAWVIEGQTPRPAGLFAGGCQSIPLEEPVASGDTVAVTLEDEGGAPAPTSDVLLSASV